MTLHGMSPGQFSTFSGSSAQTTGEKPIRKKMMASPAARRFESIVRPITVPGRFPGFVAASVFADRYRFGNKHGRWLVGWAEHSEAHHGRTSPGGLRFA